MTYYFFLPSSFEGNFTLALTFCQRQLHRRYAVAEHGTTRWCDQESWLIAPERDPSSVRVCSILRNLLV